MSTDTAAPGIEPSRAKRVAWFSDLPDAMQLQLDRIARLAVGMSASEKATAKYVFATTAANFATRGEDDTISAAEMCSALGVIVAITDGHAHPEIREVSRG